LVGLGDNPYRPYELFVFRSYGHFDSQPFFWLELLPSNGECDFIFNIHILKAFQWYEKWYIYIRFIPCTFVPKFWNISKFPTPKMEINFGNPRSASISFLHFFSPLYFPSLFLPHFLFYLALTLVVNLRLKS